MSEKTDAQIRLIREILGLREIHDPVESVRILFEQGRVEFERLRGPAFSEKQIGVLGASVSSLLGGEIVVCRGSLALGTGCGHCQKCLRERAEMGNVSRGT